MRDRVTKWIRKGVKRGLEDRMEASKAAEFIQETMVAIRSREGTSFICQMLLKRRFPSGNVSRNKANARLDSLRERSSLTRGSLRSLEPIKRVEESCSAG